MVVPVPPLAPSRPLSMSLRSDQHPFPYPEVPDPPPPFPKSIPWDSPISNLVPWWLLVESECGHGTYLPFRLMSAQLGWTITLRSFTNRLKCGRKGCGKRPHRLTLFENASGDHGRHGARPPFKLALRGG